MQHYFLLKKILNLKIFKFILAGAINTVFGYAIFATFIYLNFGSSLALFISTVLGITFNYLNFGKSVFNARVNWARFNRFLVVYAVLYLINVEFLKFLTLHLGLSPYLGQMIYVPVNALISWFLLSHWVYTKDSI